MATLTLCVSDALVERVKNQLKEHGYTIEEFIESSLLSFADAGEPIDAAMEAKLLEGLDSPLLQPDQIDWDAKIRRLESRRESGAA